MTTTTTTTFTFDLHGVTVGGIAIGPADLLIRVVKEKVLPFTRDWPHLSRERLWRLLERSSHGSVTVRSREELMREPWRSIAPTGFSSELVDDYRYAEAATVAVRYRGRIYVACFIRLDVPECREEWRRRFAGNLPEIPGFYLELACGRLHRAINAAMLAL